MLTQDLKRSSLDSRKARSAGTARTRPRRARTLRNMVRVDLEFMVFKLRFEEVCVGDVDRRWRKKEEKKERRRYLFMWWGE